MARLWGMTVIERLLRQLSALGIKRAAVLVPRAWHEQAALLRPDFAKWTAIEADFHPVDAATTAEWAAPEVAAALAAGQTAAIVLDGHLVLDIRILRHLGTSPHSIQLPDTATLAAVVTAADWDSRQGIHPGVATLSLDDLDTYLQETRKKVDPYLIAVHDEERLRHAERETFAAVYKGATDFVTKWVFYHPTRWIVRRISPTLITPNQITTVSMVLSFGAIIPFFMGWYGTAVVMGFIMALLDTVDGKLARTTLRTSVSGELLDHVSDTAYLLLWYVGLGWSLSGGRLFDFSDPMARTHAVLLTAFVADKILTGLYKRIFGFELHDYTRLDYVARIFIARRNPFLVGMSVGLALGRPGLGLQIITIWYLATLAFHLARFGYIPLAGTRHQSQQEQG